MSDETEVWKPVPVEPFSEYYSVSSLGRIRRDIAFGRRVDRLIRPRPKASGYCHVNFSAPGCQHRTFRIHVLVALAFLGERPGNDYQVNHRDGNKTNNRSTNLEWVTGSENIRHAFRRGLIQPSCGSRDGMSKLTEYSVLEIRRRLRGGETQAAIAADFNVRRETVSKIARGSRWRHI